MNVRSRFVLVLVLGIAAQMLADLVHSWLGSYQPHAPSSSMQQFLYWVWYDVMRIVPAFVCAALLKRSGLVLGATIGGLASLGWDVGEIPRVIAFERWWELLDFASRFVSAVMLGALAGVAGQVMSLRLLTKQWSGRDGTP